MNKKQKTIKDIWGTRIKKTEGYEKSYFTSKKVDKRLIDKMKQKTKILDVGCFYPYEAIRLARAGFDVTAIDLSKDVIKKASKVNGANKLKNLKFKVADATKLPFKDRSFESLIDLTTSVIIPNWKDALSEYSRVLKKNGELVIVTNNLLQPYAIKELVRQRLNGGIHPRWGHFSPTFPWQLKNELAKAGFKVGKFDSEVLWNPILPFAVDRNLSKILSNLSKYLPFLKIIGWRYGFYAVKVVN